MGTITARREAVYTAPVLPWRLSAAALLALAVLTVSGTATAAPLHLSGTVVEPSPEASHAVWIVTNLDLTRDDQPVAVAAVDPSSGAWSVDWDPNGQPYWVFVHERYQPAAGPPIDHFLPDTLIAHAPDIAPGPIDIHAVDPAVLMNRARISFAPKTLTKLALLALGLFGLGFGVRRVLRRFAATGKNAAPLRDRGLPAPRTTSETRALMAILAVALALRLWGMSSDSLELLEVSYLPGIGRPSPFGGGATGFAAIGGMFWEMSQLYCLDLTHPPLYHFLMGVMGLFGRAAWFLRLPGLVASIATLLLLHAIFRRHSVGTGLAAAGVFAVAAPAIYFGQDATPYAAVGLVAMAMVHTLLAALERGTERAWGNFFVVLIVGFLTHYNVAFVGLAGLASLLIAGWFGRADPRWPAAIRLATGPALKLAIVPLAWTWLHLSTFPTVAQDTRLVADTYAIDPGPLSFLGDFVAVTAAVRADGPKAALVAVVVLLVLGLHRALVPRGDAARGPLGVIALTCTVVFVGSVFFFYDNVRTHLGGRVFYGFRWVSWYHPVLLGLCALGAVRGAGPAAFRGLLAAVWFAGIAHGTFIQITEPRRPDYRAAAQYILDHAEDRDAVASLPTWFQRGILGHYFFQMASAERSSTDGEAVWMMNGKRITIEAVHPSLPFESTAANPHYDRIWVAVIKEVMFGRDKFSADVARQAVAWADENLRRVHEAEVDGIRLILFEVPRDDRVLLRGEHRTYTAGRVVLNSRTYPRDAARPPFVTPVPVPAADVLDRSMANQAPMSPGCIDWEYDALDPELQPDAPTHWLLELLVPVPPEAPNPKVVRHGPAQVFARRQGDAFRVTAVGGPCTGPAPTIELVGR